MNRKLLKELKMKLEREKILIEKELKSFAKEDKNLKGDWDTKYPRFDGKSENRSLETASDEVEEYITLLPIEYNLEIKLRDINSALEKLKKDKYGKCEKCQKPISPERLRACPEAKTCARCNK